MHTARANYYHITIIITNPARAPTRGSPHRRRPCTFARPAHRPPSLALLLLKDELEYHRQHVEPAGAEDLLDVPHEAVVILLLRDVA